MAELCSHTRRNDLRHEFNTMPELQWAGGYPFAILLMAVVFGVGAYEA